MSGKPTPFLPPHFSNFAKGVQDLLKKKFDFEHSLKTINKTGQGVTIESGAVQTAIGLRGYTKGTFVPVDKWGKVDAELHTDPAQTSKIGVTVTKLHPGLGVSFTAASRDKDPSFKKAVLSEETEYSADYFAVKTHLKTDTEVHKGEVQGSFGFDNVAIGGIASLNQNAQLIEANYGVEYTTPSKDLIATVYTEKNQGVVNAAFLQAVTRDQKVGAVYKYEIAGKMARTLTVGSEYRLDTDTEIKAKVELPTGLVSTAVQHRLANPRVLLNLAASFNTAGGVLSADKFGASVTLGDF